MTPQGRLIIGIVALVAGVFLVALGVIVGGDQGMQAAIAGTGLATSVTAYTFGDRNGEKRLAAAMVVAQADSITNAAPPRKAPKARKAAT